MASVASQTFPQRADSGTMREVYLERLRNDTRLLKELGEGGRDELNTEGIKLLQRCIFAAYCTLRELGYRKEVDTVLANVSKNF